MARNLERYDYLYSEVLEMEYAQAKDGSHVYTQDGVRYSLAEIKALSKSGGLSKKVHQAKKVFDGEIINGNKAHRNR